MVIGMQMAAGSLVKTGQWHRQIINPGPTAYELGPLARGCWAPRGS